MTVPSARDRLPRYLNLDGGWLGLTSEGLDVDSDGSLTLARIPDVGSTLGPLLTGVTPASAPGGLAVVGAVGGFVSDPALDAVWALAPCVPDPADTTDCQWTQVNPGSFDTPRGLLIGPRGRLYVADSGHDQIQVLEPTTGSLVGRWDGLTQPELLAADGDDRLYVLDRGGPGGAGRVQRFTADGVLDQTFQTAVLATASVHSAERMTTTGAGAAWRLLVVDRPADPAEPDRVVVLDTAGAIDPAMGGRWSHPTRRVRDPRTGQPIDGPVARIGGLAASVGPAGGDRLYVVDAGTSELLVFDADGGFVAVAPTPAGTLVADVHLAADGRLWTYPAGSPAPSAPSHLRRLDPIGSRVRRGLFVAGPVVVDAGDARLGELRVDADSAAPAHLALASTTTASADPDPAGLPGIATWANPFDPAGPWTALPSGSPVTLLPPGPGTQCWIGGVLSGEGTTTPVVRQAAVVVDPTSWLDHLPAIYRNDPAGADFLERFLRVIRTVQSEESTRADDLALLFDPATAPDVSLAGAGTALDRLAGWLDVDLDEAWSEAKRREVLASTFARQAVRGTPDGLRQAVLAYLGVDITISEPANDATLWRLDVAGLDDATMLCPAPFDGAVLGRTAVVDQSTLTAGNDPGAPLFADLAHRFCVRALAADVVGAGGTAALTEVIDREKPAHTAYRVCLADADMRVGMNARVGVDSIVGGSPKPLHLDTADGGLDSSLLAPPTGPSVLVGSVTVGGLRLA